MTARGLRNLLFDLDGTLVDSSGTIAASLEYALAHTAGGDVAGPPVGSLIGRPLYDIFTAEFSMTAKQAAAAIARYREHYDTLEQAGSFVYPDVPEVLSGLRKSGYRLFVATVKPTPIAEKVLTDLRLRFYFDGVAGASLGPERRDKSSIIAHALESFGLESSRSMMIGDRDQDINGAREHGLRSLAVTWGFGSRDELDAARPDHVAERSTDLLSVLGPLAPPVAVSGVGNASAD